MNDIKTIKASDLLNWKLLDAKGNALLYRKYLPETLSHTDDGTKTAKEYTKALEHFKTLVQHKIKKTSTGEYSLSFSKKLSWWHRDIDVLVHNLFEHTLKRWCLDDELSISESIAKTYEVGDDGFFLQRSKYQE